MKENFMSRKKIIFSVITVTALACLVLMGATGCKNTRRTENTKDEFSDITSSPRLDPTLEGIELLEKAYKIDLPGSAKVENICRGEYVKDKIGEEEFISDLIWAKVSISTEDSVSFIKNVDELYWENEYIDDELNEYEIYVRSTPEMTGKDIDFSWWDLKVGDLKHSFEYEQTIAFVPKKSNVENVEYINSCIHYHVMVSKDFNGKTYIYFA